MRGRYFFRRFPHEGTPFAVIRNHPPAQSAAQYLGETRSTDLRVARCGWLVVVGHEFQRERLARVDPELREHPLHVVAHRVRVDSETLRDLAVKPWARRR